MGVHEFTALVPVTVTGPDRDKARDYARGQIDDALEVLDDTIPAQDIATGPAVLIDPLHLLSTLTAIREKVAAAHAGEIGRITALNGIDREAAGLLDQLRGAPEADPRPGRFVVEHEPTDPTRPWVIRDTTTAILSGPEGGPDRYHTRTAADRVADRLNATTTREG